MSVKSIVDVQMGRGSLTLYAKQGTALTDAKLAAIMKKKGFTLTKLEKSEVATS